MSEQALLNRALLNRALEAKRKLFDEIMFERFAVRRAELAHEIELITRECARLEGLVMRESLAEKGANE